MGLLINTTTDDFYNGNFKKDLKDYSGGSYSVNRKWRTPRAKSNKCI
jgi:hypothetical protein